jgi:hypothetical protein
MRCSDAGRMGRHLRVSDVSGEDGEVVPVFDVKAFLKTNLYTCISGGPSLSSPEELGHSTPSAPMCSASRLLCAAYLLAV